MGLAGERDEPGSRDHHSRPDNHRHRDKRHRELDAGSTADLGWTVSSAVATGQFGVWLVNQTTGTWYEAGYFNAVAGQTAYTPSFTVPAVPPGAYQATVWYRVDPTQWVWQANAMSLGAATIAPALSINVTVPNGTENWTTGSTANLGWTVSSAVATGQFGVWLVNQTTGTWYEAGYFNAVAGQFNYTPSFTVPPGASGYLSGNRLVPHRSDAMGLAGEWLERLGRYDSLSSSGSTARHWRRPGASGRRRSASGGGPLCCTSPPRGSVAVAAACLSALGA